MPDPRVNWVLAATMSLDRIENLIGRLCGADVGGNHEPIGIVQGLRDFRELVVKHSKLELRRSVFVCENHSVIFIRPKRHPATPHRTSPWWSRREASCSGARWTVQRYYVMVEGIDIRLVKPGDPFMLSQDGSKLSFREANRSAHGETLLHTRPVTHIRYTLLMIARALAFIITCVIGFGQAYPLPSCQQYIGVVQLSNSCVSNVSDLAFDDQGRTWVADAYRIMRFPTLKSVSPIPTVLSADLVLGRPDFTTLNTPSSPPCPECFLDGVQRLVFDKGGNLWVVHNLGLSRFAPPFTTFQKPDLVLTSLGFGPLTAMAFDLSGNLWASAGDGVCDRVLMFTPPFQQAMRPKVVIGQSSADTCLVPAPGPNRVALVRGLAVDGSGDLLVADNGNSRIAIFRPPFSTFMPATFLIGQTDPNAYIALAFADGGLAGITDLGIGSSGELWVLHNFRSILSAYTFPFISGQQRSYWAQFGVFGGGVQYPNQRFPFDFNAFKFHFTSERAMWLPNHYSYSPPFDSPTDVISVLAFPVVSPLGVVNAASFQMGSLSPGEFVTIFGVQPGFNGGLSNSPQNGALSTGLGKTSIYVNDRAAPMLFDRYDQASFQVPYETDVNRPISLQAEVGGIRGPVLTLGGLMVSPGLFTLDGRNGAVLNHLGTLGPLAGTACSICCAFATGSWVHSLD